MKIHDLKIDPQPFADLVSGVKTCEVRNDDRGFEVGDTVRFPGGHCFTISHIQRGYGLPDGLCVLSYAQASAAPEQEAVAWLYSRPEDAVTPVVLLEKASDKDRGSWDETPLYTHADPSDVERLRAEIESMRERVTPTHKSLIGKHAEIIKERDGLRQKLSEAQALLRICSAPVRAHISRLEEESKRSNHPHLYREEAGKLTQALRDLDASLSATAQPAEVETQPTGHDQLWGWFGLSRSTWLAIPRVLMHAMPDDWQQKMAALMSQWDETWDTSDLPGTQITGVRSNRFAAWPHWLMEYRHPDHAEIEAHRRKPANGRVDAAQPAEVKS